MSHTAILLIVASAIVHAGWNAAGKRIRPSASFFAVALGIGCVSMSPLLLWYADSIARIPLELWPLILLTGAFQAVYYAMLAAAYRCGDMSIAYPLTRSSTVLLMAGMSTLLRSSTALSSVYLAGLGCIAGGSLVLPLRSRADLQLERYFTKSCLFALFAAAGTTGCMLVDEHVLLQLLATPREQFSNMDAVLMYAPLQSISAVFWLSVWIACDPLERREPLRILREHKFRVAIVGLGIYASYGLLLLSRPHVANLSYSVALRQMSIPLGAAIGIYLLKEPLYFLKSAGAAAITAGVVLVALG